MRMKICISCHQSLPITSFYLQKNSCKKCRCRRSAKWHSTHKKYTHAYAKEYGSRPEVIFHRKKYYKEYCSRPEVAARRKQYSQKYEKEYGSRPEVIARRKQYAWKYRQKHLTHLRSKEKEWCSTHKEHIQAYAKAYCSRPTVVARRKQYMRKYVQKHWIREHHKNVEYVRQRWLHDPVYRLRMNLRNRLNNAIRRKQKGGSAVHDLGCSVAILKTYLESQFQPGMTWKNWSRHGWNIHHKQALETFDLADPKQFKQAVHYTNLQPMWADQNIAKGNRFIGK